MSKVVEEEVIISRKEYDKLLADSELLQRLQADNWESTFEEEED